MSTYTVERHDSATAFLARALDWLLSAEAEHNLILAIAQRAAERPNTVRDAYFATIAHAGKLVGCALRTPPYKLVLTQLPAAAVPLVAQDIAATGVEPPAVLGPEATTAAFAAWWGAKRGTQTRSGMRQRVYQLARVVPPRRPAPGALRLATSADVAAVAQWVEAFSLESGVPTARARALSEERIVQNELFIWEDAGIRCSMAAWSGRTPNGVRIGYVYTPPELRAHGYASTCVAEVSQRALDHGFRFCFLFTDVSNPTSNAIYQSIGYTPVSDVVDYWLA